MNRLLDLRANSQADKPPESEKQMRHTRMFGLIVTAAVVAMALAGVPSAGAESTSVCKLHEASCAVKNQAKSLHLVAENPLILFTTILGPITIVCKESLASLEVGALGAPQTLTFSKGGLTWTNCEQKETAEKCEVGSPQIGSLSLLKTSLNLGKAEFRKTQIQVKCKNVLFDCTYGGEGVGFLAEGALHSEIALNGEFIVSKVQFELLEGKGGASCLKVLSLDARYRALEHFYIVS